MGLISALTAIGDAIRTAESSTAKILLTDMPARIKALATSKYNSGVSDGKAAVTLSASVSGRTVTATTSNGKTASASVALGTGSGSTTFTLTPTGNNTATKAMAAGYYNAGTITANGATSYAAGVTAGKASFSSASASHVSGTFPYTTTSEGLYVAVMSYSDKSSGYSSFKFGSAKKIMFQTDGASYQSGQYVAHAAVAVAWCNNGCKIEHIITVGKNSWVDTDATGVWKINP